MQAYKTVDEDIKNAPQSIQEKLRGIRTLIKEFAPEAEEKISYGMPFYAYHGRLVYFAYAKNHIGLYIPPPIIQDHADELKAYTTTKSAIHLPLDQDLPRDLIQILLKARMMHNGEQEKKKN